MLIGEFGRLDGTQEGAVTQQTRQFSPVRPGDALDQRIGLRMDGTGIQRVLARRDAQEAGTLLEGTWPQTADLQQLLARGETPVGITVRDDVLGKRGVETGDA